MRGWRRPGTAPCSLPTWTRSGAWPGFARRGRHLDSPGDNPLLLEEVQSIGGAAAQLARAGYSRDYLIADTPGSFMRVIEEAITAADCVVLPVQASPLDVLAQEDIARLVNKRGKEKNSKRCSSSIAATPA